MGGRIFPRQRRPLFPMQISLLLMQQIAQLFLILLMGYAVVKTGLLKAADSRVLSVVFVYLITPCVVLLFNVSMKVFVSSPTFFAISAGFLNNSMMVRCKAVADISTF